jgi:hypothetical protein
MAVAADMSGEELLEQIVCQDASLDDSYERVTF